MKLSELIEHLDQIRKEHGGDLKVLFYYDEYGDLNTLDVDGFTVQIMRPGVDDATKTLAIGEKYLRVL